MYVCKDCGGPVSVTRNERRLTLPPYHIVCEGCPAERNVSDVPGDVSNGVFRV